MTTTAPVDYTEDAFNRFSAVKAEILADYNGWLAYLASRQSAPPALMGCPFMVADPVTGQCARVESPTTIGPRFVSAWGEGAVMYPPEGARYIKDRVDRAYQIMTLDEFAVRRVEVLVGVLRTFGVNVKE